MTRNESLFVRAHLDSPVTDANVRNAMIIALR